jgi:hypothetical protein
MNYKDLIIDFINFIFIIILISFCIVYFIVGDRMGMIVKLLQSLVPIAMFGILLLTKLKLNRMTLKKRIREDRTEIILNLTYMDKIIGDLIIFSMPIIIIGISIFAGKTDTADIVQAAAAFLIVYFWQTNLFKKEK